MSSFAGAPFSIRIGSSGLGSSSGLGLLQRLVLEVFIGAIIPFVTLPPNLKLTLNLGSVLRGTATGRVGGLITAIVIRPLTFAVILTFALLALAFSRRGWSLTFYLRIPKRILLKLLYRRLLGHLNSLPFNVILNSNQDILGFTLIRIPWKTIEHCQVRF